MTKQESPPTGHSPRSLGEPVIDIRGLTKKFGAYQALKGVDLQVSRGEILGLLGPNGAGKTTTVRILTTLLRPDSGTITVSGHDLASSPAKVRSCIGLSGQYAAVDEKLSGFENLYLVGRLYGMRRARARTRARDLLERFQLTTAADQLSGTYSGGMRRRLDLAGALVAEPPVVVLDEPTTGLDPQGRIDMWEVISGLVSEGTTVLLTTQYLEEADQLADSIAVIDAGRVISEGTADELKAHVGGNRVNVVVQLDRELDTAADVLATVGAGPVELTQTSRRASVAAPDGQYALNRALDSFSARGISVLEASLSRPTLDDVFLQLTGHRADENELV